MAVNPTFNSTLTPSNWKASKQDKLNSCLGHCHVSTCVTQLTISTLPIYSGYKSFIYICDRKVPFSGLDSLINEQGFAGNSWLHRLLYRGQQPFSHDRQIPMPDVGHKRGLREWRRRRVFVIGISVSKRSEINSSSVKSVSSYFLCVIWLANADN